MISLPHISVMTYGGLAVGQPLEFSGSGGGAGGPPKQPKTPTKPPKKKKK